MNFYKRHIGDYLKDTAHLSLLEHGVYTRLLDVYYTRESGIPNAQAARLIGARGREESTALKVVLDEFFELVEGTWVQDRCEREIHATGPKQEDGETPQAKSGKALRQQAYRERRASMFEALRERGVTMPFKATMEELQDALLNVTKTPRVMPTVTAPVMPAVTGGEHNVTATISQTPDSTSQTPDLTPVAEITHASGAPRARPSELSAAMRRHSIEAQPGDPRIIAAAEAGVTVATIEAACAQAKAAKPNERIPPNYVVTIAMNWTADAAAPRPLQARSSPTNARDESRRHAYEVLTGKTAGPQSEPAEVINGHIKLIG